MTTLLRSSTPIPIYVPPFDFFCRIQKMRHMIYRIQQQQYRNQVLHYSLFTENVTYDIQKLRSYIPKSSSTLLTLYFHFLKRKKIVMNYGDVLLSIDGVEIEGKYLQEI
jgi:hypothetical protein